MLCLMDVVGHQSHLRGSAGQESLPQGPGQLPYGLLRSRQCPAPFETKEAALMVSESPLGSFFPCLEEWYMFAGKELYSLVL